MGLRARRSIRIFKGLKLNFSKSGLSVTVGTKGASATFGKNRERVNVGIPGTGLSYSKETKKATITDSKKKATQTQQFMLSINKDGEIIVKYADGQDIKDVGLLIKIMQSQEYKDAVKKLSKLLEGEKV